MKLIAATLKGIEDIAIKEIKEKLKANAKKVAGKRIQFNSEKIKDLRSINALYELITKFKFKNKEDILEKAKKIDFKIKDDFKVECNREGAHNFKSIDIEKEVGEIIYKKRFKVNLKSSAIIYIDIIDNNCFIGYLIKNSLCKRLYRIKPNNKSINACLAYSLLKISNYKPNQTLLDPFCKDAVILIEAALEKGKNLYGLDETNNIRNAKINAKLAKVKINFNISTVDWLDTKFKQNSINKIITIPPILTKKSDPETVRKTLKELFYQSKYILKDTLTLITQKDDLIKKYASDFNFKLIHERKVSIKTLDYKILVFKK